MATLVGNPKYGEGHEVILKDKLSNVAKQLFADKGYTAGEAKFKITKIERGSKIVINLGTGSESILLKDSKNNVVKVVGSASSINNSFNHFSENAKSDTGILTEIKENVSMMLFESYFERRKVMTEEEVINTLPPQQRQKYDSTYYESSLKQLEELKKYVSRGGYNYERQGQNITKDVYVQARKLSGLANDNWNPADVWMIKKNFTGFNLNYSTISNFGTIAELNGTIAKAFESRDVIPISLKNVTADKAQSEIVLPAGQQKVDLNLAFDKVDLSQSFNNFIVYTKSGFASRVGYKGSSTTLSVSIEGRMSGAGYQMGAVDAKRYVEYCSSQLKYTPRSGVNVTKSQIDTAKKELKSIMDKYSRISTTITSYKQAMQLLEQGDELTKKRFANLISYMYSFLIAPKNFKKHMEYCYFSSKKISDKSCVYLLLK